MANRDLLKEAIADAKAVKETAIANAKAALEEAFRPHMQELLAQKLKEMDEADETNEEVTEMKEKELEEMYSTTEEGMDTAEEGSEVDLEELLKELDSLEEESTEESLYEAEDELINNPGGAGNLPKYAEMTEEEDVVASEEEEIDLENMSEDDLKSFIESVISDMVAAGELEAGDAAEEGDESDEEKKGEESAMAPEEDVNLEELMNEIKKAKKEKAEKEEKKEMEEMKKKLDEAYSVIETIKSELAEVNLFNAKLLYTNKIFKAKNLTESQKVKVLAAFDKAASVKEAKLVYETLSEGFTEKKTNINESVIRGSASKPAGVAEKKPILEVNDQFARWQKLAGIK